MKLARPDIFHPRIVLAGSPGDDAALVGALRRRGLHARWLSWDDPDTRYADLVIVRGAAADRRDAFLAWTRRVANLLNAPDVIAWNADQRYRRDLEHAGVPTLGGRSPDTALIFLGGRASHAFSTTAGVPVDADYELWDLGHAALRGTAERLGIGVDELLYARADVAGGPEGALLASLDLVAPSLGWGLLDDGTRERAQRRFALCVESALQRLGLGPFSHRRP